MTTETHALDPDRLRKMNAYWRAANYLSVGQIYRYANLHVRGYKEEGTTSTPFDTVVRNELDRFDLVADVIDRVPQLGPSAVYAKQAIREKVIAHKQYIAEHGEDLPEIRHWQWHREAEYR